jgi:hypothetical protein
MLGQTLVSLKPTFAWTHETRGAKSHSSFLMRVNLTVVGFILNPSVHFQIMPFPRWRVTVSIIVAAGRSWISAKYVEFIVSTISRPDLEFFLAFSFFLIKLYLYYLLHNTKAIKVKGRFIGPSSALQPYRPIVPLAPMSSLIYLQRHHVPHRHERPQPAKEGIIQGILLTHS